MNDTLDSKNQLFISLSCYTLRLQ